MVSAHQQTVKHSQVDKNRSTSEDFNTIDLSSSSSDKIRISHQLIALLALFAYSWLTLQSAVVLCCQCSRLFVF